MGVEAGTNMVGVNSDGGSGGRHLKITLTELMLGALVDDDDDGDENSESPWKPFEDRETFLGIPWCGGRKWRGQKRCRGGVRLVDGAGVKEGEGLGVF